MTDLDEFLERARMETASIEAPGGFTDCVMRSVRRGVRPVPTMRDLLPGTISSGALVGSGAFIWLSLGDSVFAPASLPVASGAATVAIIGFVWAWLDDPFSRDTTVRLSPW